METVGLFISIHTHDFPNSSDVVIFCQVDFLIAVIEALQVPSAVIVTFQLFNEVFTVDLENADVVDIT